MASRHRKLRLHYAVGNDLNLWWCSKLSKWVELDNPLAQGLGKSSSRGFRTKRRAFGHAGFMGAGFRVTQFDPHCGRRRKLGRGTWLIREWEVLGKK